MRSRLRGDDLTRFVHLIYIGNSAGHQLVSPANFADLSHLVSQLFSADVDTGELFDLPGAAEEYRHRHIQVRY